jgi:hypothetical protein
MPIVGDTVIVRGKVTRVSNTPEGVRYEVYFRKSNELAALVARDIVDVIPAPETDWNEVPLGTAVRVRDLATDPWVAGKFVSKGAAFWVLMDGDNRPRSFVFCEVIE